MVSCSQGCCSLHSCHSVHAGCWVCLPFGGNQMRLSPPVRKSIIHSPMTVHVLYSGVLTPRCMAWEGEGDIQNSVAVWHPLKLAPSSFTPTRPSTTLPGDSGLPCFPAISRNAVGLYPSSLPLLKPVISVAPQVQVLSHHSVVSPSRGILSNSSCPRPSV